MEIMELSEEEENTDEWIRMYSLCEEFIASKGLIHSFYSQLKSKSNNDKDAISVMEMLEDEYKIDCDRYPANKKFTSTNVT